MEFYYPLPRVTKSTLLTGVNYNLLRSTPKEYNKVDEYKFKFKKVLFLHFYSTWYNGFDSLVWKVKPQI